MGELAAALGIDPPNATVLVDDLEDQGLVRRQAAPHRPAGQGRRGHPQGEDPGEAGRRQSSRRRPRRSCALAFTAHRLERL